jgi:triosephosphate isomerase
MAERTRVVIGNWKQNLLRGPAAALARAVADGLPAAIAGDAELRVGVAPSYLALDAVAPFRGGLWLVAQDAAAQESGAFTGEVGPAMLAEAGVDAAILGHSERRGLFGDTDALVARKLSCALTAGLWAVLCVGETLAERERGQHESIVISQLSTALAKVDPQALARVVVAYEPVWAIGTGRTATPAQAAEMHRAIRASLARAHGPAGRDRSIVYGGSVKAENASELAGAGDIDGFLVGGASLDPTSFLAIVKATARAPR